MTCGVTNPRNAWHLRDPRAERGERENRAIACRAMIGIDVLANQSHLAYARPAKRFDFGHYAFDRTRGFRATRVRYDTKGAKFIATFLHGHEGGHSAGANALG